ncbi:MAG: anti-FecI sigma factor FecR [Bradyrhizobium sp.]|nr:anti-FecI sigma factor FecR [Bradyrhizobium sp.]
MKLPAENTDAVRREAASDWCVRLADGPIPLEQQIEFELWLDADPLNREAFEGIAALWHATLDVADAPELIGVRADALEALRTANRRRWSKRLVERWRPALALAACLLVLVTSSLWYLNGRPQTYQTAVGERRVVKLEDGSRISLDAATSVEVSYNDERRALRLIGGRAKFDVAKDPRRPFTVSAGGRMVVATGTAFSVELVQSQMRVVLYEGNVAVLEDTPGNQPPRHLTLITKKQSAADQSLKPGTMMIAALDQPLARVEATDLARSLSWEGGQLTFADEPLAIAAERINRYSDEKIVIGDAASARMLVSGAFNAGDTEGFVDGVSALYPLRAKREGNVITLSEKNGPS